MAQSRVTSGSGMALFSTRNGKYAQRQAASNMSIVIRSDPAEDRDTMTTRLFNEFPEICKAMTTFTTPQVIDYFDGYDQELHGYKFLQAVLLHIIGINARRARDVQDYVRRWLATNTEAFAMLLAEHTQEHLFTEDDIQEYGKDFLGEAAVQIKRLKEQAYHSEATRESIRLREQHDFMAEEHRRFTQFRDQPPPNVPVSQNPSASFALERHHRPARHWPMVADLPSQSNCQQGRLPQPYPHPPFSGMENAYTGPGNQPHSHPESTHPPPSANYNTAIPSQGFPGPSGYGPHTRPPISERHQIYNSSKQPKGRRNPVKKSSDDARRASFDTDARYQTSTRRRFSQPGAFRFVQSPQPMLSPMQQATNPSYALYNPFASTDVSLPGTQQRNRASGSDFPTTRNEISFSTVNYTQPSRMIAQMDQLAPDTHRRHSSHREVPVSSQETQRAGSHASETVQPEKADDVAQNQGTQNVSDARTLDLNGVGQQLPTIQTNLLGAQSIPENLAPPSFGSHHGQARSQDSAQRSSNEGGRSWDYTFVQGSRIFVGGIPVELDISAVKSLLGAYCQGFVDITHLYYSNQQNPQRRFRFAFADFDSQQDAEKALDRIPQIQIPNLAERRYLFANWPRTPNKYQQKSKTNGKRNTPQSSPTKNRNTKIMNDPIIEEDSQMSMYDRRKPSNAPGNESVSSEARSGIGSACAPALPPPDPLDARPSTEKASWATIAGSKAKDEIQEMPPRPEMASRGAEPLTGEEGLREAKKVPEDDKVKGGAVAWSQSPTKAKIDPSTVDGASDGAKTTGLVESAQKHEDSKPARRDDKAIPATQANKANRKQKSKNKGSKTSNTLQKSEGVTISEGIPKLENIKPSAKPEARPTEEAFLEGAALPEHEDDVAKPSEAEIRESSVSASARSSRAVTESEIQRVPDYSIVTSHHGEATNSEASKTSQSIEAELPMATGPPEDQSIDIKSTSMENKPDIISRVTSKTPTDTTKSEIPVPAKTPNEGTELYKQVMSPDDSNTTFDEDGNTSVAQPSTAETSYFPTERSNSIVDESQLHHSNTTEDVETSRVQKEPKPEIDAATLTRLLQPGPPGQGDHDPTEDSDAQLTSTHAGHTSPKSSSSIDPTEETCIEKPLNRADESSDVAAGVPSASSRTKQPSAPISPDIEAEKLRLSAIPNPREEVSAPIQTRHKKKPKELAVNEEYRHSDDEASLSKKSALTDDQNEGVTPDITTNQADLLISSGTRTAKQKKNAKSKKNKKAKKTQIPAAEPPAQTWSPDRSMPLPKPETPFQTDGDMSSSVARRPDRPYSSVSDSSTGHNMASHASTDRTEDSKLRPNGETCTEGIRPGTILTVMPSDSSIVKFSQLDSSADGQEGISSALEEAGYRLNPTPDSSRHFEVKDPMLKLLEQVLQEQERVQDPNALFANGAGSSDGVVDRVEEFKRQFEIQKLCEQAAAVRRHQAGLPPRTPTNTSSEKQTPADKLVTVKSLNRDIEKIASGLMYSKAVRGERDITNSVEDRKIQDAKELLDSSPPLDSKGFTYAWLKNATDYIKENQELLSAVPPYTPTRKSRTSNSNPPSPSSNSPFRREERQFLGSPTALKRPGSAIKTRPGSATAFVPLKPGEDPSKILAEYEADPNAFFGLGRQAQTKPTQSSKPSDHNNSKSEVGFMPPSAAPLSLQKSDRRTPAQEFGERTLTPPSPTPISPQTTGSRTHSKGREKRVPSPPSLRQRRPSAKNLTGIFENMKEKATSEWLKKGQLETSSLSGGAIEPGTLDHTLRDDPKLSNRKENLSASLAQADAAPGGPLEEDVVAFWGNNSGARDLEMQHEVHPGDSEVENGGQDRECRGNPKDLQEPVRTTPGSQSLNNRKEEEKQEEGGHMSSPDTVVNDGLVTPPSSEDAIGDIDRHLGGLPEQHAKTSHEDEVSHSHKSQALLSAGATLDNNATDNEITHPLAPAADTSESSLGLSEKAAQKAEPSTPTTFNFGSEGSAIVTGDDGEIDFPVLPRGHNRRLKGGKSTSPTRGGYAAVVAAKRKEVSKTGKQLVKPAKNISNGDGWVVTGDEAWGSGRRNSSTKSKENPE